MTRKARKRRRAIQYLTKYNQHRRGWVVVREGRVVLHALSRRTAHFRARWLARNEWKKRRHPCELRLENRGGGYSRWGEASYGCDSPRRRG